MDDWMQNSLEEGGRAYQYKQYDKNNKDDGVNLNNS